MRTIVIGCDNAAVHLKNELMGFMEKKGYTVENMGCDSTEDSTYYPYVAEKVCLEIINSGYQKHGVLICGTDGNVICMGERVIGAELAKRILEKWLELEFVDCASTSKVEAIKEIEGENLK